MGHLCTMLGKKKKKNPYWGHTAKNSGQNEILRFLKFLSSSASRLALLDLTPDSSSGPRQLLRAYFRSKKDNREVYELDPPPFGTSAENPGADDLSLYHRQ